MFRDPEGDDKRFLLLLQAALYVMVHNTSRTVWQHAARAVGLHLSIRSCFKGCALRLKLLPSTSTRSLARCGQLRTCQLGWRRLPRAQCMQGWTVQHWSR